MQCQHKYTFIYKNVSIRTLTCRYIYTIIIINIDNEIWRVAVQQRPQGAVYKVKSTFSSSLSNRANRRFAPVCSSLRAKHGIVSKYYTFVYYLARHKYILRSGDTRSFVESYALGAEPSAVTGDLESDDPFVNK